MFRPKTFLIALLLCGPALAEDHETLCNIDRTTFDAEVAPMLVGEWTANPGAGTLTINGGPTMAIPPGSSEPGTVWLLDNRLVVGTSQGQFDLNFVEGQGWGISAEDAEGVDGLISTEDLGLTTGCPANDMVRMTYGGTIQDGQGTLNFEAFVYLVSDNYMYGTLRGDFANAQGSGTARRVMTFTR